MTEDQSPPATGGGGGKKARRGRRQDDTLPPSRSRDVQRAFRARRAAHLTHLESTVDWLQAENAALRQRCGLPEDGPPLTGPAPVEEVIDGPAEIPPVSRSNVKKGASKEKGKNSKARASGGGAAAAAAADQSDGESTKMEDEYSPIPHDEARGAAEVLAAGGGGGGNSQQQQNGISLPPMNIPSSSTAPQSSSIPQNGAPPLSSYSLPQQTSPRLQSSHFLPQHPPYLAHHPHSSVSYSQQGVPAYAQQQYQNPYASYSQNPGPPPYNSFYPQHQQQYAQQQQNNGSAFSMTLPPNQNSQQSYPPTHPPSLSNSNRNSISSNMTSPQSPSSHVRSSSIPTAAPLQNGQQQHYQQHQIYPTLIPPPSSNFPSKSSPNPSFPLKPISDINQQQPQSQQDGQPHEQQMMYNPIFPTPSPEDEQFFLDTFCGLANENMFLQSLYPPPEVYDVTTIDNAAVSNGAERKGETENNGNGEIDSNNSNKEEEEDDNADRGSKISTPSSREFDATSYKNFCIGLMKGVQGIEGLIAQKRKRDREHEEESCGDKKRKRLSDGGRSREERQEKEDEAVAFLAEAARMASSGAGIKERDGECCDGIIDCGPPSTATTKKDTGDLKKDEEDCCGGLIDCGPVSKITNGNGETRTKTKETKEECCSGLISCDSTSKSKNRSPSRPKLARIDSLPPPPSTIYLPLPPSTAPSSCCGPQTTCTLPPASSSDPTNPSSQAYILVSLAFTQLSPYMSPQSNLPVKFSPTRLAEFLYNDNPTISSVTPSPASKVAANLIIVPPSKEQEERGKKGELYVRKEVVDSVKKFCEEELGAKR